MSFLYRWLIIGSLFLIGCTGFSALAFVSAAGGNVVSEYIFDKHIFKEYEPVSVKIVRLFSGEELIGEFDEEKHIIKNPVVMVPVNN